MDQKMYGNDLEGRPTIFSQVTREPSHYLFRRMIIGHDWEGGSYRRKG